MHHVSGYVRRRGMFARPAGWNAWSLQHALTRKLLSARPSGMLSDTEPLWHQLHTMRQVGLHAPCVCAGTRVAITCKDGLLHVDVPGTEWLKANFSAALSLSHHIVRAALETHGFTCYDDGDSDSDWADSDTLTVRPIASCRLRRRHVLRQSVLVRDHRHTGRRPRPSAR